MGKAFKLMGIPMTEIEKIPLYADELKALKPSAADGLKLDEEGE